MIDVRFEPDAQRQPRGIVVCNGHAHDAGEWNSRIKRLLQFLQCLASEVSTFLHESLIDECVISVHPLLLGAGIPLFESGVPRHGLRLTGVTPLASGLVQLRYTGSKP